MKTSSHGQKGINVNKKHKKLQGCGNEGKRKPYSMQPTLDTWRRRLNLMHYYISTSRIFTAINILRHIYMEGGGLVGLGCFFSWGKEDWDGKKIHSDANNNKGEHTTTTTKKKKKTLEFLWKQEEKGWFPLLIVNHVWLHTWRGSLLFFWFSPNFCYNYYYLIIWLIFFFTHRETHTR